MNLRNLVLGTLLVAVSPGLPALEWEVDSDTTLGASNIPSPPANIEEELLGNVAVPLDTKGGAFVASAHAWVGYPSTAAADFDTLNFRLVFLDPGLDVKKLTWTLGRYMLTEPTGLIVNQPVDGSQADFRFGAYDIKLSAGYTYLVQRSTTTMVLSVADQESEDLLTSPRFFGSIESNIDLPAGHTLSLNALAQQDLTSKGKLIDTWSTTPVNDEGGKVDTEYLTAKAEGPLPLTDRLFYSVFATFEAGSTLSLLTDSSNGYSYEYKPITAMLGGFEVSWFYPQFLSSSVTARAVFASGDGDYDSPIEGNRSGNATFFIPVTTTTLGTAFNPALSNLGYYELGGSVKPWDGQELVTGAKLLGFQRLVAGTVNASGVLRNGPIWMGQEIDGYASWQPYSDLQVTVSLGAFMPTSGTFASSMDGSSFQYALNAGVNLSL